MGHGYLLVFTCVLLLWPKLFAEVLKKPSSKNDHQSESQETVYCPDKDLNFKAVESHLGAVLVSWKYTKIYYEVEVALEAKAPHYNGSIECRLTGSLVAKYSGPVLFNGLCPGQEYDVSVIMRCDLGERRLNLTASTSPEVPGPPKDVKAVLETNSTVTLSWKSPGGLVKNYRVHFWKASANSVTQDLFVNDTWVVVRDRLPSTKYCFGVSAKTYDKWGPPSQAVCARTSEDPNSLNVTPDPLDAKFQTSNNSYKSLNIRSSPKESENGSNSLQMPSYRSKTGSSSNISFNEEKDQSRSDSSKVSSDLMNRSLGKDVISDTMDRSSSKEITSRPSNMGSDQEAMSRILDANKDQKVASGSISTSSDHKIAFKPINSASDPEITSGRDVSSYPSDIDSNQKVASNPFDITTDPGISSRPFGVTSGPKIASYPSEFNFNPKAASVPLNISSDQDQKKKSKSYNPLNARADPVKPREGLESETLDPLSSSSQMPIEISIIHMSVDKITNTSVRVTWSVPEELTPFVLGYRVTVVCNNCTLAHSVVVEVEVNLAVVAGLRPVTSYDVTVSAKTVSGWGNESEAMSFKTAVGIPGPPSNLKPINVTNTTAEIRWNPPAEPNGDIETYKVTYQDPDGNKQIAIVERSPAMIVNLTPFTKYKIKVYAATEKGYGPPSEVLQLKTAIGIPNSPRNLTIEDVTNTSVVILWIPPEKENGPDIVYRAFWKRVDFFYLLNEVEQEEELRSLNTNETSLLVKGLLPNEMYDFWVRARTSLGWGPTSEVQTVLTDIGIPGAPTNLSTNATNTSITLSWDPPHRRGGPLLTYIVGWKELSNQIESFETPAVNDTSIVINNLVPYTKYELKVLAETDAGKGPWSDVVVEQTSIGIPGPPTNLSSEVTNVTITIKWSPPLEPNGPGHYLACWSERANPTDPQECLALYDTWLEIVFLIPYKEYEMKVLAENAAGRSPWSNVVTNRTLVGIPGPPINLTTEATNTSITLAWNPPHRPNGPWLKYVVCWRSLSNLSNEFECETMNETSLEIDDLIPFTKYEMKVSAETSAGQGSWSDVVTDRTLEGLPGPPLDLTISYITNTTVELLWEPPVVSNGRILSYRIIWESSSVLGISMVPDTFAEIKNLRPDDRYCFKVLAKTSAGLGPRSDVVCNRTTVGIPGPPSDARITGITNTTVSFTWNPPKEPNGPILGYTVSWNRSSDFDEEASVNRTKVEIRDLDPFTVYCVVVSARTSVGTGATSVPVCNRTDIGIPGTPIIDTTQSKVSNSTITLRWYPPSDSNGPIVKYAISYGQDVENFSRVGPDLETDKTTMTVRDLLPYTQYRLSVRAATSAGWGPRSTDALIRTDVAVPGPALMEEPLVLGPRSVRVTWRMEGQYPGPTLFHLQVWRGTSDCREDVPEKNYRNVSGSNLWSLNLKNVGGLLPHTHYHFRVLVETRAGGTFSNASTEVQTLPDIPGPPMDVKADCSRNPTSARVTWGPPDPPNGEISSYRITYTSNARGGSSVYVISHWQRCDKQSFLLKNMRPEVPYWITVQAEVNDVDGYGPEARDPNLCVLPAGIPPVTEVASSSVKASSAGMSQLQLRWSRAAFSSEMGKILHYAIIVGVAEAIGSPLNGSKSEMKALLPTWFFYSNGTANVFQVTPPEWNPFEDSLPDTLNCEEDELMSDVMICVLGNDLNCSMDEADRFCNGPLKPDTEYGIKVRGFTRGGFSETQAVFARTESLPSDGSHAGLITAIIFLVSVSVALVAIVIMFRKHPERKEHFRRVLTLFQRGPSLQSTPGAVNASAPAGPEIALVAPFSRRLELKDFLNHVKMMMSDSFLRFSLEFEELKRQSPRWPCLSAEMEENRLKNRWMNIFPFDHSRVKLLPIDDEPGSDFVNANFIPGHSSQREYIASQGPLQSTVDDFWRMVWEQGVALVVMLTQCVERGKSKCEQYWPSGSESHLYGDLKIQMISESILAAYVIRIFVVQLGQRERRVKQMHFTRWPDFGSPEKPDDLINFVRAAREHLPRGSKGPILVHCSAGVGRTGTYIAVDRLMQHLEHHQYLDVYETVLEMRQHRTNMVQTEDQYIYIHKCMRDVISERLRTSCEDGESSGDMIASYSHVNESVKFTTVQCQTSKCNNND